MPLKSTWRNASIQDIFSYLADRVRLSSSPLRVTRVPFLSHALGHGPPYHFCEGNSFCFNFTYCQEDHRLSTKFQSVSGVASSEHFRVPSAGVKRAARERVFPILPRHRSKVLRVPSSLTEDKAGRDTGAADLGDSIDFRRT